MKYKGSLLFTIISFVSIVFAFIFLFTNYPLSFIFFIISMITNPHFIKLCKNQIDTYKLLKKMKIPHL